MTMSGEVALSAPRETVWKYLNDPLVLKASIPGCQSFENTESGGYRAVVKFRIGPISVTFKGNVELLDLDPMNGYRLVGQGDGGVSGFATGSARVSLADHEAGTLLRYDVDAKVGGKILQLGGKMIDSVAKSNADAFFANFARQIAEA